jgi:hypothetical protein
MSKTRVVIAGLLLVIVLAMGLATGLFATRLLGPPPPPKPLNTATVLTQVQGLAQLVTVKYVMEKVVVLEDVKFFGENRVLLVAHGVVKAGVDLAKIQPGDIRIRGKRIVLTLPAAVITDAYLDEDRTQVIEQSTGLLRRFDKDLQQNARAQGLGEIRRAARDSGILEDASERASQQLQFLLHQLGFEEVAIRRP